MPEMVGMGYIGLEPGVLYSMSGATGTGQEVETEELDGTGSVVLPENVSPTGLLVYGKCEQYQNSGAQLFDCGNAQYVDNLAYVQSSNTFSTGTSSGRMYYIEASPGTTYTISKTLGTFLRVCTCPAIPANGGAVTNSKSASLQTTITTGPSDKYLAIYPLVTAEHDTIGYDAIEKELMVNVGSTALPWEAYTGGVSLPDPDQPQEIRSVGVRTRNLLDEEAAKDFANWAQYPNAEGSYSKGYWSYRLELRPNTTYTVSHAGQVGVGDGLHVLINTDYTNTGGWWIAHNTNGGLCKTKVTLSTSDEGYLYVTGTINASTIGHLWDRLVYLQIEEGDTATEYEPYGYKVSVQTAQQKMNVYMREPLRGVPVASGGNYTDVDGQQWACDVLDLGARKVLRRTAGIKFDENDAWAPYINGGNAAEIGFYVQTQILPETMWRRRGWCNQFPVTGAAGGTKTVWIGANNARLYFIGASYDSEQDDKGLADWLSHLAENPIEVVTYLTTETEEDLLPGGTEISVDGGGVIPGLSLEYQKGE